MDKLSKEHRSLNMSRIKSKNTCPELLVRKALSKLGYRYRINYKTHGHPDIAFPKSKIAIFVHGCFWHKHGCKNSVIPKTNRKFWSDKLRSNIKRDEKVAKMLKKDKWSVFTIWECKLEKNFDGVIDMLNKFLSRKLSLCK